MLHSHLTNYSWQPGFVASDEMLAIAQFFKDKGLLSLGYSYANFDDCIVVGRDPVTHALIPDPQAFPMGPRVVADALSAMGFSMVSAAAAAARARLPAAPLTPVPASP